MSTISKEERERDKAVCEAATRDWRQGHHVGEPKSICAASHPNLSLLGLDCDGMAIFARAEDAAAAVHAVNRLPVYVAALDEIEQRIATLTQIANTGDDGVRCAIRVMAGARAPVQADPRWEKGPGTIDWSEHVAVWYAYAKVYGHRQNAATIAERGGFSYGEIMMLMGAPPRSWAPVRSR